jgi:hypothetical protein
MFSSKRHSYVRHMYHHRGFTHISRRHVWLQVLQGANILGGRSLLRITSRSSAHYPPGHFPTHIHAHIQLPSFVMVITLVKVAFAVLIGRPVRAMAWSQAGG